MRIQLRLTESDSDLIDFIKKSRSGKPASQVVTDYLNVVKALSEQFGTTDPYKILANAISNATSNNDEDDKISKRNKSSADDVDRIINGW